MTNATINSNETEIDGTSLVGYITISGNELVEKLGAPLTGYNKVSHEWIIEANGMVATIYDYKENYAINDTPQQWHVGGHDVWDAWLVLGEIISVDNFKQA